MRRFALAVVLVGGVLLGLTVVVASQPDRARARIVRAPEVVLALRAAVLRGSPAPGARPVPLLPVLRPRAVPAGPRIKRALVGPSGPLVPGGSCDVAAGCSLHPCVTYASAAPARAVLRSSGTVAVGPQVLSRPRPAPTLIVPIPRAGAARRPCVTSAPAQRLVSARILGAG